LRALANNRDFLLDFYFRELKALYDQKSGNLLTPQSVTLARTPDFFVRSNIWLPPNTNTEIQKSEQKIYAYNLPHDHNFDFVTVGYYGEGYETDLFQYDIESVTGYIGEPVEMMDCGRERLTPGRIMIYKANTDIHIQYEPSRISVSLNLVPILESLFSRPQFVFDPVKREISAGVSDQVGSRVFLLDFCRHMHDDNTVDLLETIMTEHPCSRTRGQCLNVLEDIMPDEKDRLRSKAPPSTMKFNRSDLVHAGYARQKDGI